MLFSLLIDILSQELESVNYFQRAKSSSAPHTQGFVIVGQLESTEPRAVFVSSEKNIKTVILKETHCRKMQHSLALVTASAPGKINPAQLYLGPAFTKAHLHLNHSNDVKKDGEELEL